MDIGREVAQAVVDPALQNARIPALVKGGGGECFGGDFA